jgi:molecular chaperone DnaJ
MIATTCRACSGRGRVPKSPCTECEGRGQIEEKKTLEVRIPPGVDNGVRLRLQGEGGAGDMGGPPGDLYVFLSVKPHELYVREGANLHCELAVSFANACFGTTTTLPKIGGGEIEVKVPAGMQPGDTVRLQGHGLPRLGAKGTGDIIVHLTVSVPQRLNDEQRRAVEKLGDLLPTDSSLASSNSERKETRRRKKAGGGGFLDRLRDAFEGE